MVKSTKETILTVLGLVCVFAYFLFVFFLRVDGFFFVGCDDVAKGVCSQTYIDFFIFGRSSYGPLDWTSSVFYVFFPYVGQVPQYFAAVFMFLFSGLLGPLLAFRMTCAFYGAGILLCVFFVLRQLCSRTLALWTVFFLGTNSMFVESVRHGFWREEIFQIFGLWLGVLCLLKGLKTDKYGWTALGMFVFGVTLWAKMMFLGYILGAAAGFTALYLAGYSLNRQPSLFSLPKVFLGIVSFLAGCLPLLVYNLFVEKFETVRVMLAPVLKYQDTGVTERLSWFLGNLQTRAGDVLHYSTTMLYRDDYGVHWFDVIFTACAVLWCIGLVFLVPVNKAVRRFLVFIFSAYTVVLFLTGFIVVYYLSEHIIILVPFFEMLCAVFVVDVFERIKKPFIVFVLTVVIITGWGYGHARYEYVRYANKDSRKGYLWDNFMTRDMDVILADFAGRKVKNLCCIHDFGQPFKFFSPDLNIGEFHCVDDVEKICGAGLARQETWFLFTDKPDVSEIESRLRYSVTLESEYDSHAGKYEKLYLFRIRKL